MSQTPVSSEADKQMVLLIGGGEFHRAACDHRVYDLFFRQPDTPYATSHRDGENRAWHVVGFTDAAVYFEMCWGDCMEGTGVTTH